MEENEELEKRDLNRAARLVPKVLVPVMEELGLVVAGGLVRSAVAGEEVSDVDVFGPTRQASLRAAERLLEGPGRGPLSKEDPRRTETEFAITVRPSGVPEVLPIQLITRWSFSSPAELLASFDLTVCQAAVWREGGKWLSLCGPRFYRDLAARRLVWTGRDRDGDNAGETLLRLLKFSRRGYHLAGARELVAVLQRFAEHAREVAARDYPEREDGLARAVEKLVREVDPSMPDADDPA